MRRRCNFRHILCCFINEIAVEFSLLGKSAPMERANLFTMRRKDYKNFAADFHGASIGATPCGLCGLGTYRQEGYCKLGNDGCD